MKFENINRKFSETVANYMAQGYIINAGSMSGSQGEIAHVDMTDGKKVIRILLDNFIDHVEVDDRCFCEVRGVELVVGIASAEDVKPNRNRNLSDTIWKDNLEVVSCEKFYKLNAEYEDDGFFGTLEQAIAAETKRLERYRSERHGYKAAEKIPAEKVAPILKDFVRKTFNVNRFMVSKLSVSKYNNVYTVAYNGNSVQLH